MIQSILSLLLPIAQVFLLFKIWRELRIVSSDSEKREELKKHIRDFGAMFAAAAEVPKPPKRSKVADNLLA
jgi:hypothetical protein